MIVVVLVASVLTGLAAGRWRRRRLAAGDERIGVKDLVTPGLTLTTLVLAFMLVQASASFDAARDDAAAEADAVQNLYQTAGYAPPPQRQAIQAAMVCYGRAVQGHEWIIDDGSQSSEPSHWAGRAQTQFATLAESGHAAFRPLVSADQARANERRGRVGESVVKTPLGVYIAVLVALAVTLIGYGVLLPGGGRAVHLAALSAVTGVFALMLLLIYDMELPFTGMITVEPTAIETASRQLGEQYAASYPGARLPCDQTGRPS
ncbi:hypothetical protein SMC26_22330 [Actinomadura fulvescens]